MDVVLNYCYTLNVDLKSKYSEECWLDANDIEIKFTRNRSDSQLVKTQSLKNMLDSGVAPLVAFKYSGIFSDPQKAYEQSKEYLDKFYEAKSPRENGEKQLDINSAGNEYNLSQNMQKEFKKAEN